MANIELDARATAYHEAGHAVAHRVQGLRFREASTIPKDSEGTLGHVLSDKLPKWFNPDLESSPRVRLRAESHIVALYAGQIAEARFRVPVRTGMEHDHRAALDLALYLFGSQKTTEAFLNYTYDFAEDLVQGNWWAVTAVAEELMARRRLTWAQTIEVLQRAALSQAQAGERTLGEVRDDAESPR